MPTPTPTPTPTPNPNPNPYPNPNPNPNPKPNSNPNPNQAAAKEPFGVTLGAIIGHGICTGIAVIGGKLLASRISERMTLMAGGALFILFAIAALIQGPASSF